MTDTRLVKLFAWTIGVLLVLWLLAECAGGADEADPRDDELDRDTQQHAADCDRTWQALDAVATANPDNVEDVVDRIDTLSTGIEDLDLRALTGSYGDQVQDLVDGTAPEDLPAALGDFHDRASFDLALRCPAT